MPDHLWALQTQRSRAFYGHVGRGKYAVDSFGGGVRGFGGYFGRSGLDLAQSDPNGASGRPAGGDEAGKQPRASGELGLLDEENLPAGGFPVVPGRRSRTAHSIQARAVRGLPEVEKRKGVELAAIARKSARDVIVSRLLTKFLQFSFFHCKACCGLHPPAHREGAP